MGKSFSICFKKDIVIPLAFVSDKIIRCFTTQSVILNAYIKLHFEYCCVFWGEEPVN